MADDELVAVLAEAGDAIDALPQAPPTSAVGRLILVALKLAGALTAAAAFHQRVPLYGNAATDGEPGACPHDPDSDLHFEDGDGSGEWLCEGKPEGAVCSTCVEDGLPVAWPCPEYEAIRNALTGKAASGG